MVQVLTETELAAIVGALDTTRFVNKTVYGCGCGGQHGAVCPGAATA